MSARRTKWHPPPPPTPRILHLPRRSSRRSRASTVALRRPPPPLPPAPAEHVGNPCGILEELFDQDRSFSGDRRARVDLRSPSPTPRGERRGDSEEERWRLEAEVLRAECNFLRMEREVALQKLESNRVQMEMALRSAVQTLVSGRKKIDGEQGMGAVLQEEIEELQSKLEQLQGCSRRQRSGRRCTTLDLTLRGQSSGSNFDRKACRLRRRLEEMAAKVNKATTSTRHCEEEEQDEEEEKEIFVREIREIASESASVSAEEEDRRVDADDVETKTRGCLMPDWRCRLHDVEILRMKMEGVSKVLLQRMETYESSLSSSSSSSSSCRAARAAATISRTDDPRAARTRQASADCAEDGKGFCSGRCREVVGKVMEQVRAEAQQWNEMQSMLGQVRREMEDLQCARDFWERCAVASDAKLRAATAHLLEWRQKAQASEQRVSELQTQVRELQVDVETLRGELSRNPQLPSPSTAPAAATSPSRPRPQPWSSNMDLPRRIKCHPTPPPPQQQPPQQQQQRPLQQLLHKEKERRVLLRRRSKENHQPPSQAPRSCQPRRPPLQEIGNSASAFPCRT